MNLLAWYSRNTKCIVVQYITLLLFIIPVTFLCQLLPDKPISKQWKYIAGTFKILAIWMQDLSIKNGNKLDHINQLIVFEMNFSCFFVSMDHNKTCIPLKLCYVLHVSIILKWQLIDVKLCCLHATLPSSYSISQEICTRFLLCCALL